MRRTFACVLACVCLAAACAKSKDTAPPVARPTVTVNHRDAAVGTPIEMTYRFVVGANAAIPADDYVVFAHFIDRAGEMEWTDDHQPPTPIRNWQPGQTVEYTRTLFVPKVAQVGETQVDVGLYSPKTGNRLPLDAEAVGQREYRVATLNVQSQGSNVFVVFKNGWHSTEVADRGSLEWQWSRKEGTVSFRNPHRDVVLMLDADQPVTALPGPQHVDLRIGSTVIDSFMLAPGARVLRQVPLRASQLGADDTVEMLVDVDPTFVPATIPQLRSTDSRELGIRVFRVYIQPT
jgi:hypothetical protein